METKEWLKSFQMQLSKSDLNSWVVEAAKIQVRFKNPATGEVSLDAWDYTAKDAKEINIVEGRQAALN